MRRSKTFYVYLHKSPSGKYYVGITSKYRVQDRWDNGNGYKGCPAFYNAITKYGWNAIEHYIVASGLSEVMAKKLEIHLIPFFKACNRSYNITNGGDGHLGYIPSEETRRKLGNGRKGKHISEEQKIKLSKAFKGRKAHPNTIKAIIRTHTGKVVSEETRKKLRECNLGKHLTKETKEKLSIIASKPVLQYDLCNNFIKEWKSASEAAKSLNKRPSSITHCCNHRVNYNTAYGYKWEWKYDL